MREKNGAAVGTGNTTLSGGALMLRGDELTGRAHAQAAVRMDGVVVLEPFGEALQDGNGIRPYPVQLGAAPGAECVSSARSDPSGAPENPRPFWDAAARVNGA